MCKYVIICIVLIGIASLGHHIKIKDSDTLSAMVSLSNKIYNDTEDIKVMLFNDICN
jgi:hypothetical protein